MILSLSGLCLENLPAGPLRRTTVGADRARDLIQAAAEADRLVGIFEFGAVPDPAREKHFDQLLAALADVHGITFDRRVFFTKDDLDPEEQEARPAHYANPLQLYRIAPDRPLLVVSYVFTPGLERFLDMDVASDRLSFDLVEVVPAAEPGQTDGQA
ncbi:MAG: hypothetical protein ACU0CO_02800 [Shimia sp.]